MVMSHKNIFIRKNGVFGGVCGALALKLNTPTFILRLVLLISCFCTFGLTFLIYLSAVLAFPSELTAGFGDQPKFLGVCHKWAPKLGVHETFLRFLTLVVWIFTAFLPVFAVYMILFLVNAATDDGGGSPSDVRDVN